MLQIVKFNFSNCKSQLKKMIKILQNLLTTLIFVISANFKQISYFFLRKSNINFAIIAKYVSILLFNRVSFLIQNKSNSTFKHISTYNNNYKQKVCLMDWDFVGVPQQQVKMNYIKNIFVNKTCLFSINLLDTKTEFMWIYYKFKNNIWMR